MQAARHEPYRRKPIPARNRGHEKRKPRTDVKKTKEKGKKRKKMMGEEKRKRKMREEENRKVHIIRYAIPARRKTPLVPNRKLRTIPYQIKAYSAVASKAAKTPAPPTIIPPNIAAAYPAMPAVEP